MDSLIMESEWKPSLNYCRCCLTGGCSKVLSSKYSYLGQIEVYREMLKEIFNIQLSNHEPLGSMNNELICEDCIIKLREANMFKQMVERSEQMLLEYLEDLPLVVNSIDCDKKNTIKIEGSIIDYPSIDENSIFDENFDEDVKEEIIPDSEANPKKRKKAKIKCNIKEDGADEQSIAKTNWQKIIERRGIGPILRENSLKLLENSTLCVFQWNKSRYRCFCCKEPFSDMDELKQHTNETHSLPTIEKKIIAQQNRLVKVEMSVLNCKICNQSLDSLTDLKQHLVNNHNIQFSSAEDLLVPFKIGSVLQCQICKENFSVFRLLNIHMNKHFQKQVCHICGAGFSNLVFLNLHKNRAHRKFGCKTCDIQFPSRIDERNHSRSAHGVKFEKKLRFPCPYCQERFFQENFRVLHLVEKHGMKKPEFKCVMCNKVFVTKSLCNNHVRTVHMKEKNHECDVCHHLFYTRSDVKRHRVSHTGEKNFSCVICSNMFASRDSLRRHLKRTHAT